MKSLKFNHGSLKDSILLPSSKSYGNRALILASLLPRAFTLRALPESTDVTFLISALKKIGLDIRESSTDMIIQNSFPACEGPGVEIDVGEGGTTARFLACLLLRGKAPYTLVLGQRLKDRPWDEFLSLVESFGGKAKLAGNRLFIQGPLKLPKHLEIDCTRTTQFASGFQMAWAFEDVEIVPSKLSSSQSYWEMTKALIKKFTKASEFDIPLDWSSASYPLAFGALNQNIRFPALHDDHFQSDAKFLTLLKSFGAIEEDHVELRVKPMTNPHAVDLDVSDCLDLVPTLGFFLSHVPGRHTLRHVSNLIHKESDRLHDLIALLKRFGKVAFEKDDSLIIEGSKETSTSTVTLTLADDHRMVMVGALFLAHHQGGFISPVEAVRKSYPDFFEIFNHETFTSWASSP